MFERLPRFEVLDDSLRYEARWLLLGLNRPDETGNL